ncbi:DNA polymerase II large subunit [Methanococcoides sp. SA1]|nr:DNA polymerase II large subunit [Methanococcoides sp. SA1]
MSELDFYFEDLKKGVDKCYGVAKVARAKNLDPVSEVESPLALNMAERVVNLVRTIYPKLSVEKVSKRILELEVEYGKLDSMVAFVVAREIARGEFCKFGSELEGIDCGLRVGFAYLTLGVVASPMEGYTGLKLGKTRDGKDYFIVSFSGPIRSAGTTAVCIFLMLVDFLREEFGYGKYDIGEDEVGRYITEIKDFHNKVSNLAYFPTEEEMDFLARHIPFQIDGDPTERIKVSGFKDLERVESNRIRGGMCLAFGECLALKAGKAFGRIKSVKDSGLNCSGFDWVPEYMVLHKKRESGTKEIEATYIKDIVAGRPVYGHPGASGSFRFRYGRSRTSGFSGVSVHPATMGVSGNFLAHGTQLRLEKPTKAAIITGCDLIDGPIVKLKSGSVKKLSDYNEALKLYKGGEIEEVVYLGDLLFPVGDVIDRNADLIRPGYVEEWWAAEVEKAKYSTLEEYPEKNHFLLGAQNCDSFAAALSCGSLGEVVEICRKYNVALHPSFIFYWTQISKEEFFGLLRWLNGSEIRGDKLILNWEAGKREEFGLGKRALELLGVSHEVVMDNVVVSKDAQGLLFNLGKEEFYNGEVLEFKINEVDERGVLEIVNSMCSLEVRDKWGTGIGARMGRPEKAKSRKLVGSPNSLFPVGSQGGRLKSLNEAVLKGYVKSGFGMYKCECGKEGIFERCECGKRGKRMGFCRKCGEVKEKKCKFHSEFVNSWSQRVEIGDYFEKAVEGFDEVPELIKGVGSLTSESKIPENLVKGILRAKYNLSVNKDGTVRYDAIEIPLTHFKAKEIGVSVERLKELGYLKDVNGEDLVSEEQVLELMPHDVVLPDASVLGKERIGEVFCNVANFVDEELEKFYGLEKFYSVKSRDDLVGLEVVCIAPHNCAGVIGRIIGFSKMQGFLASPYMHAAMRRDCDGDECSVMLLMDVLLNFSRKFLPSHRGGSQDAPLVLNARIYEGEVDDQILFFESCGKYPLEFYEAADKGLHSSAVRGIVELIGDKLKQGKSGFVGNGFGFDCDDFNYGNNNSVYKSLPSMKEKVAAQMELVGVLRGVDEDDVARLILERHFIRDIRGNLRKFAKQQFRCSSCNEKYRRPPLSGSCWKCNGKLIFTVSEGSVRKYLDAANELVRDYNISSYTRENMELIGDYIERIFGKGDEQVTLGV